MTPLNATVYSAFAGANKLDFFTHFSYQRKFSVTSFCLVGNESVSQAFTIKVLVGVVTKEKEAW